MTKRFRRTSRAVLVAGGGVAAFEGVLALRALAGTRASITMVSPQPEFVYAPLSVGEPFATASATRYPLARIARDLDIELVPQALTEVDVADQTAITTDGGQIAYDTLLMTLGAVRRPAFERAVTFAGGEDSEAVAGIVRDIEGGYTRRLAFVVPAGVVWSLPLYELALMTARRAYEMGVDDLEATLVTPEERPLGVFGADASRSIERLLGDAGVRLRTGVYTRIPANGRLELHPTREQLQVERVVALPRLEGNPPVGVRRDTHGFVPVDTHGRVLGADDLYAAGDMTTFPVKQGGIACQQADAAAQAIARDAGVELEPKPFDPILRGRLMTGAAPHYVRNGLRGGEGDVSVASASALWWPPGKVAGKYLAPYLARLERADAEHPQIVKRVVLSSAWDGGRFGAVGLDV